MAVELKGIIHKNKSKQLIVILFGKCDNIIDSLIKVIFINIYYFNFEYNIK
jgi:hypothetical protein